MAVSGGWRVRVEGCQWPPCHPPHPLSPHWQVEALMERVEELTKDKVRLLEEYEAKLAKAQECYERELEAMRRTHQLTTENLLAWKRTEVRVQ